MKFKVFIILIALVYAISVEAQWSGTSTIYTTNLNAVVGIGTQTPSQKLQIKGGSLLVSTASSTSTSSGIRITGNITQNNYNWLIGANIISEVFAITPSTTTGGTTFSNPAIALKYNGNVGIGINDPTYKLHVNGSLNISSGSTYNINGTPHTHTQYPEKTSAESISGQWSFGADQVINSGYKLCFGGQSVSHISFSTTSHELLFKIDDYSANNFFHIQGKNEAGSNVTLALFKPRAGVELYFSGTKKIETTSYGANIPGSLCIGVTDPGVYKLNVWGKIRAHEVVVNTTGADFVFYKDYNLKSLTDLEKYINENNHLPGVFSASEMQKNGLNLGEMQTLLLQKVEELTLYIIDLGKKNELQNKEIELLRNELIQLKDNNN